MYLTHTYRRGKAYKTKMKALKARLLCRAFDNTIRNLLGNLTIDLKKLVDLMYLSPEDRFESWCVCIRKLLIVPENLEQDVYLKQSKITVNQAKYYQDCCYVFSKLVYLQDVRLYQLKMTHLVLASSTIYYGVEKITIEGCGMYGFQKNQPQFIDLELMPNLKSIEYKLHYDKYIICGFPKIIDILVPRSVTTLALRHTLLLPHDFFYTYSLSSNITSLHIDIIPFIHQNTIFSPLNCLEELILFDSFAARQDIPVSKIPTSIKSLSLVSGHMTISARADFTYDDENELQRLVNLEVVRNTYFRKSKPGDDRKGWYAWPPRIKHLYLPLNRNVYHEDINTTGWDNLETLSIKVSSSVDFHLQEAAPNLKYLDIHGRSCTTIILGGKLERLDVNSPITGSSRILDLAGPVSGLKFLALSTRGVYECLDWSNLKVLVIGQRDIVPVSFPRNLVILACLYDMLVIEKPLPKGLKYIFYGRNIKFTNNVSLPEGCRAMRILCNYDKEYVREGRWHLPDFTNIDTNKLLTK